MAKLLERPAEQLPTESDTLLHEAPERIETPSTEPSVLEAPPQRRPIRWMRWLAVFVVLVLGAAVVAVLVTAGDGSNELDPSYATAELNRFTTLSEMGESFGLDSYATAELNRFTTLSEMGESFGLDSYATAELNRFTTLSEMGESIS